MLLEVTEQFPHSGLYGNLLLLKHLPDELALFCLHLIVRKLIPIPLHEKLSGHFGITPDRLKTVLLNISDAILRRNYLPALNHGPLRIENDPVHVENKCLKSAHN